MWSGHVHRVYAERRTIAAENKCSARQKSGSHGARLDLGVAVEAAVWLQAYHHDWDRSTKRRSRCAMTENKLRVVSNGDSVDT